MSDVRAYRVLLTPDPDDGGYVVRVPAFPAIITQGDNLQDALVMAQDAIRLELALALDAGAPPPPPTTAILKNVGMTADELRKLL